MTNKRLTNITLALFLIIALLLSIIPDIYRISITSKDTTFPLIHNNAPDYFYYLSLMHQGWEGKWFLTTRMTPEKFPSVLAQTFFALLGHIAKIAKISLPLTYFLSRIILGATLLLTIIFLAKKLFQKETSIITACLFAFFGTGFWTLTINKFLAFWTRLDPVLRTTYLPHHLLSTALAILSIIFLSKALDKKNVKKAILAGIFGLLSGLVYFATMINILGGVGIAIGLKLINNIYTFLLKTGDTREKLDILRTVINNITCFFYYFLLSFLSLAYLLYLAKTTFPWSTYNKAGEGFTFFFTLWEYVANLGPTFLLTLLGLPLILKKPSWLVFILFGWLAFPFFGIFKLNKMFPQFANVYFLEATSHIPAGILAVYGLKTIKKLLLKKLSFAIVILLFLYFIPPTIWSIKNESKRLSINAYNNYLPKEMIEGIKWLDYYTPKESIVLAGGYLGNIIPAYTHNRVVYGHPANTFNSAQKHADIIVFFSQKDKEAVLNILKKHKVSYVFFSLDTDPPKEEFIQYLNLEKIYENEKVKIFKVK